MRHTHYQNNSPTEIEREQAFTAFKMAQKKNQQRLARQREQDKYIYDPGEFIPCMKPPRYINTPGDKLESMITAYRSSIALSGIGSSSSKHLQRLVWREYERSRGFYHSGPYNIFDLQTETAKGRLIFEDSLRDALRYARWYRDAIRNPNGLVLMVKRELFDHGYYRRIGTTLGLFVQFIEPWGASPARYIHVEYSRDPTPPLVTRWEEKERKQEESHADDK